MSNEQTCKTQIEDLRNDALKHYEEASRAIHHWSSFVEAAIKAYNPEQSKLTDKPKQEDRIYISHLWQHDNFKGNGNDAFWYQFCTSKPIEHINNSVLKQAIECVVNNDAKGYWETMNKMYDRKYTQKEVDTMIATAKEQQHQIDIQLLIKDNGNSLRSKTWEGEWNAISINSVKREKDGAIISIGSKTQYGIIKSMHVSGEYIYAAMDDNKEKGYLLGTLEIIE